jgi:carbonic anhydrase
VVACFVFGHTKCGAVKAAFDAFKPGGSGVGGIHPSIANILREIKPAVDLVIQAGGAFPTDDAKKDAISFVNAVLNARRAEQMVSDLGVAVQVFTACYHVDDFLLRQSNFPQHGKSRAAAFMAEKGVAAFALDETGKLREKDVREALIEDALDFVNRR